jgi:hypothetical protein
LRLGGPEHLPFRQARLFAVPQSVVAPHAFRDVEGDNAKRAFLLPSEQVGHYCVEIGFSPLLSRSGLVSPDHPPSVDILVIPARRDRRAFASPYVDMMAAFQACLREGKDSPNTKYRSRSALLQERASKLVSGGGELTTRVEPAMIGCEA